jgi:hypothetical protein
MFFLDEPGSSNNKIKNSTSAKSNITETIGNVCDIPEKNHEQNVHTKENHKQRQKHQNNAALKENGHHQTEAPDKYKSKFCSHIVGCSLHSLNRK